MRTITKTIAAAWLGLALAACSDTVGSITDVNPAGPTSPASVGNNGNGFGNHEPISTTTAAPALQTMHAEFWAVQGKQRSVTIRYVAEPDEDEGRQFLKFTVSNRVQLVRPDGRRLVRGDSLLISVDVLPGKLEAEFSPGGLVFADGVPAQLEISYYYGDTRGKPTDQLGMWYIPTEGDSAEPVFCAVDGRGWKVQGQIYHFSNYAVAY